VLLDVMTIRNCKQSIHVTFRQYPRSRNWEGLKTPPFLGCANKMLLLRLHKPTTEETAHLSIYCSLHGGIQDDTPIQQQKAICDHVVHLYISASVTFETNISTNRWKGFGSLSSGLSQEEFCRVTTQCMKTLEINKQRMHELIN